MKKNQNVNGKCESNKKCILSSLYYDDKSKKCVLKPKCTKNILMKVKKNVWLIKNVKRFRIFNKNKPKCKNGETFDEKKGICENKKCLSDFFIIMTKQKMC